MQTEKKPGAPDYFFCDVVTELQALVEPDDNRFAIYEALALGNVDNKWLDVGAFCAAPQPTFNDLTIDTLVDGSWTQELQNCALASVFFRLCREVPPEMLQSLEFELSSADLNAWTLIDGQQVPTPKSITPGVIDGKIVLPIAVALKVTKGEGEAWLGGTLLNVKFANSPASIQTIQNPLDGVGSTTQRTVLQLLGANSGALIDTAAPGDLQVVPTGAGLAGDMSALGVLLYSLI